MNFGADGLPAPDTCKRYSYRSEYVSDGHVTPVICSGGVTTNSFDHYSIVKKTYYADGKLRIEMYYDQDGTTVRPRNVQYGHLYANSKSFCLDKDGNKYS